MIKLKRVLQNIGTKPISLIDNSFKLDVYTPLDLSDTNRELQYYTITSPSGCQEYINTVLKENNAKVAFGGYLEQRNLYSKTPSFNTTLEEVRNIHLGIDVWAPTATSVLVPIKGKVHSFKNNNTAGDYGPTIILEHYIEGITFFTLYGHLSLSSLETLYIGKEFLQGERIGEMGSPEINVNYAPHLHFQIIEDIEGKVGDYPGVCSITDLAFYSNNCPNPNLLLSIVS